MSVERTVRLRFADHGVDTETHVNLSAVHVDGPRLWIAGDETATIELLIGDDPRKPEVYAEHVTFHLADLIDLPGGREEEVDVEGMALTDGYLWVVGSHSAKRKRVKRRHDDAKATKRLATVSAEPARRLLARLAIEDGVPRRTTTGGRRSLALTGASVYDLLGDDEHLAPFRDIPGKDNGLDVEGVAVHGDPAAPRVYLGLRGPVLRGWATVLQVEPQEDDDGLRLGEIDGARYAKHFLDLDGLGVRDLCEHGDDLLVLAGPSMDLDGPVRVYRWPGAARLDAGDVVHRDELERLVDLPHGEGDDHAEGIALLPDERMLVVYDSPAARRRTETGTVLADVVRLP